ncbi:CHAT domain-containing protein [Thiothrix caldifontis]|uniref:CHAT domain-containing protein n=1 Tax=Thiothrix caldifontis TaxID=525918 RepID=A0A1H4G605_9GAMM|nr:CHAT domain-containing protein [Thiothrix caldifontis]SEB05029.1 CHAT domain-containing protein [Thiothrix caldifontis]
MNLPLILLTFANDKADYLSGIGREMAQLETLLTPIAQRLDFELKLFPYTDSHALLDYLNENRERLVLLHFSGHSNSDVLQLDDGEWHIKGFAAKLGNCPHLRLVVLNGCQNAAQVHALRAANVAAVIGTHAPIGDKTATEFTQAFYHAFAEQALPLLDAFVQAQTDVQTLNGQPYRSLDITTPSAEADWAWFIASHTPDWKLADVANPCNRLPALLRGELPAKPFKNLYYYTEADAEIFFGRCQAILDVMQLLDETKEPVLLLHGGTGVGKSSFLLAGLIPRLKAPSRQQTVRYLRYNDCDPQQNLLQQLFGSTDPATIRSLLNTPTATGLPAIWIIDQLEEIFFADQHPQLDTLLTTLHTVFYPEETRPNAKLILSLRKEWFADLLDACQEYNINVSRYLLNPLDKLSIIEVIQTPAETPYLHQHYNLSIQNPPDGQLAAQIADDLLTDKQSNIAPTLQIILSRLWKRVENQQERIWNEDLYLDEKRTGLLLEDYLNQQLQDIAEKENWGKEAKESGLLLDVLYTHTTDQGTAKNVTIAEYEVLYPHISYRVALLKALQGRHLIIEPQTRELQTTLQQTRLAHDTLAQLVKTQYLISELPGQRARKILNQCKSEWIINVKLYEKEEPTLNAYDLKVIGKGQSGTIDWHQNNVERNIIKKSKRIRNNKRIAGYMSAMLLMTLIASSMYYYNKLSPEAIIDANINRYHLIQQEHKRGKVAIDEKILPKINEVRAKFINADVNDEFISQEYLFYKHAIIADLCLMEIQIRSKATKNSEGNLDEVINTALTHSRTSINALKHMDEQFVENKDGITGNRLFNTLLMSVQIYSWKHCRENKAIPVAVKQMYDEIPFSYIELYKDEHDQCLLNTLKILKENEYERSKR